MKTIVPFCLLMLIASGESGRQTTWWPKQTTWWPRQTTWWPQQTTWLPPRTGQPTHRWTTRPTRRPTGRQTTRRQNTVPGGQIIGESIMNPACPQGTFYCREAWNGRCFPRFHEHHYVTFQYAQQECVRLGKPNPWATIRRPAYIANLPSFHNKKQFDFLKRFIGRTGDPVWIGLNKVNKNQWKFSDGSPLNYVPANSVLRSGDAAALDPASGRLISVHTSDRRRYVCVNCFHGKSWPTNSIPHVVDKANSRICEHGVCYKYEHPSGAKPFYEAEHHCASAYRGHLAAFHSREQYDFLVEESRKDSAMWVGAASGNGEQWMFTDGSPMDYVPEESGLDGRPNPGCAALFGNPRVLEDQNCIGRWGYICLYPD